MTKSLSFIRQFLAFVAGDTSEVKAQKVWRQSESALKSAIASLQGDTINFEEEVTSAQEKLDLALINNGGEIRDRSAYVNLQVEAYNRLTEAKEDLEAHQAKLEFLKERLELLYATDATKDSEEKA